ncbi:hypothetical protein LTR66_003004 [Elasticomyces elasticus]|nr:hypothetical protein LTR28_005218 [Elasticomyces elasticus]KAK4997614.1 hypothetical protein LTR66_003004 [Elasticomyces elasticus]
MAKPYRCFWEGSGATVTFSNEEQTTNGEPAATDIELDKIKAVGTKACIVCVGVYFAIDNNRCFVAHMNSISPDCDYIDRASHDHLRASVRSRLEEESTSQEWGGPNERMEQTLVLTCPYPDRAALQDDFYNIISDGIAYAKPEEGLEPDNGRAMALGVLDWLGMPSATEVHRAHGFVVPKMGAQPQLFYRQNEGAPLRSRLMETESWEPVEVRNRMWRFSVEGEEGGGDGGVDVDDCGSGPLR